jgi:hypothetical protein
LGAFFIFENVVDMSLTLIFLKKINKGRRLICGGRRFVCLLLKRWFKIKEGVFALKFVIWKVRGSK